MQNEYQLEQFYYGKLIQGAKTSKFTVTACSSGIQFEQALQIAQKANFGSYNIVDLEGLKQGFGIFELSNVLYTVAQVLPGPIKDRGNTYPDYRYVLIPRDVFDYSAGNLFRLFDLLGSESHFPRFSNENSPLEKLLYRPQELNKDDQLLLLEQLYENPLFENGQVVYSILSNLLNGFSIVIRGAPSDRRLNVIQALLLLLPSNYRGYATFATETFQIDNCDARIKFDYQSTSTNKLGELDLLLDWKKGVFLQEEHPSHPYAQIILESWPDGPNELYYLIEEIDERLTTLENKLIPGRKFAMPEAAWFFNVSSVSQVKQRLETVPITASLLRKVSSALTANEWIAFRDNSPQDLLFLVDHRLRLGIPNALQLFEAIHKEIADKVSILLDNPSPELRAELEHLWFLSLVDRFVEAIDWGNLELDFARDFALGLHNSTFSSEQIKQISLAILKNIKPLTQVAHYLEQLWLDDKVISLDLTTCKHLLTHYPSVEEGYRFLDEILTLIFKLDYPIQVAENLRDITNIFIELPNEVVENIAFRTCNYITEQRLSIREIDGLVTELRQYPGLTYVVQRVEILLSAKRFLGDRNSFGFPEPIEATIGLLATIDRTFAVVPEESDTHYWSNFRKELLIQLEQIEPEFQHHLGARLRELIDLLIRISSSSAISNLSGQQFNQKKFRAKEENSASNLIIFLEWLDDVVASYRYSG